MRSLSLVFLILLSCSEAAQKLQMDYGVSADNKIEGEATETYDPRVDVLFVVDNSGSMDYHQNLLAKNIDIFVNKFVAAGTLDFHVGVVTTDTDAYNRGQLVGTPTFVENQTPDIISKLARNLMVGTVGSGYERMFEPVKLALSEPLLSNQNRGFYRPDAHLAVIFITDAEDQSYNFGPDDFLQFLKDLKPQFEKILAYGVIIPSSVNDCPRDATETPARVENFLSKVTNAGKNVMSLCDPNYGDSLSDLTDDLIKRIGRTIYLKRWPIRNTIRLQFGSMTIPQVAKKGWGYDHTENVIRLGSEIEWGTQPPGTKLKIYYDALSD